MRAYILKEMEEKESVHIKYYQTRKKLWDEWKSTEKLGVLLKFFHEKFVKIFKDHSPR